LIGQKIACTQIIPKPFFSPHRKIYVKMLFIFSIHSTEEAVEGTWSNHEIQRKWGRRSESGKTLPRLNF
jgi:hypothetical protein